MKSLSAILSVLVVFSSSLHAGFMPDVAHLVSIEDLRTEASAGNIERADNTREVQTLLRHPEPQKLSHLFDLETAKDWSSRGGELARSETRFSRYSFGIV